VSAPQLATPTLEVVSVPANHPYVRHTQPLDASTTPVRVRPDPDPDDPSRLAGERWWPPVALQPEWLGRERFDVLHVHFGYDDRTPEQLRDLVDLLDRLGRPLVLTVHDLRNPHHLDAGLLDAQLDVLVPRAAAVVTLSHAAARQLRTRWGVEATVLPHPHVVDLAAMRRLREQRRARGTVRPVVGVAVKDLRPNTDPLRLLPSLLRGVRHRGGAQLRVTAHHGLRERTDERARALVGWLETETAPELEVVWHDRFSDEELWAELARQHVAVLPYRFGTHSGWLEACHDVGTRVLAPSSGCYAGQGADASYAATEHEVDEDSLVEALDRLLAEPTDALVGLEADARAAQREQVAATLRQVYDAASRQAGWSR
jgi:hypothetical protein